MPIYNLFYSNNFLCKTISYWLLILIFTIKIISANNWSLFNIPLDFILYLLITFSAFTIGIKSVYKKITLNLFFLWIITRGFLVITGNENFRFLAYAELGSVFLIIGALVYGNRPNFLHRQLSIFLLICIPVMIIQILGINQFVHFWNTDYAHTGAGLDLSEVGTFKKLPLVPTLFVEKLNTVVIGQVRPSGLSYANNVLAIFISIFVAINLSRERSSKLSYHDIIMVATSVLSMAKLALGSLIFTCIYLLMFSRRDKRFLVVKISIVFVTFLYIYNFFFPGIFSSTLSLNAFLYSILPRVGDIWKSLDIPFNDLILFYSYQYRTDDKLSSLFEDQSYSAVSIFLKNDYSLYIIVFMTIFFIFYTFRIIKLKNIFGGVYHTTFIILLLTQFVTPFYSSPFFQLILGFSLYPIFKKLHYEYAF